MRLNPSDRPVIIAALNDHDHVVLGWDDPVAAAQRRKSIAALLGKLAEPWHDPKAHTCLPGHQPGMDDMQCECWPTFGDNDSPIPAGICIREESDGIYVMRCDQCSIFADDTAAADFLASMLGYVPWQKSFEESPSAEDRAFMTAEQLEEQEDEDALLAADKIERRYEPFFPMKLDEFYRYLAGYYNAMESRCYKALKLPLPQRREPPKLGTLSAAMHEQFKSFKEATAALKATVERVKLEALKQANERIAEQDATIVKLHEKLQTWHDKAAEANAKRAASFNLASFVKDGDTSEKAEGEGRKANGPAAPAGFSRRRALEALGDAHDAPDNSDLRRISQLLLEGDALRAALVSLYDVIQEKELAGHFTRETISLVEFVVEKTEG